MEQKQRHQFFFVNLEGSGGAVCERRLSFVKRLSSAWLLVFRDVTVCIGSV